MGTAIRNPLKSFLELSREEWIQVALMFTFFFLVITTFWVLKPVRTALLLSTLGAEETPVLKLLAIAMIALVVAGYSRLVDFVGRCQLVFVVAGMFITLFVISWATLSFAPESFQTSRAFVYAVYLLADLFSTVMVVVFWSYVNDAVDPEEANRTYGPIGLGGIVGGIAGSVLADTLSRPLGSNNLMLLCIGLTALTMPLVWYSDRRLGRTGDVCTARTEEEEEEAGIDAALEGARMVWRNPYLLLIVLVLTSYEVVSTMNDFVLNTVFDEAYEDSAMISQMYGRLGWVINGTALLTQLLLVPSLLPHKLVALAFMPAMLLLTSGGFLAAPVVLMAFPLLASDNGFNYSIQQTTKETLYVPLSPVEKFKSKAFIDMFAFRAAKALAAIVFMGGSWLFGSSLRLPMVLNLAVIGMWLVFAVRLARLYERRYAKQDDASSPQVEATPSTV